MGKQIRFYRVPTDDWYIERSVWLIAGAVLSLSTLLAFFIHPIWILLVVVTGLSSILVALTGFCIPGNLLHLLGFKGKLATEPPPRWNAYFLQTDSWYLERRIYLVVGINISVAALLSLCHSAGWLIFTGFVGVAMLGFAYTGFCIMANALYWWGAEPRLSPQHNSDQGR